MQSPQESAALMPNSGMPDQDQEPVFNAPWEAKAFAIVNHLAILEHYTWPEWTQYLSSAIAATEKVAPGAVAYYEHWVMACEKLLADKGLLDAQAINERINQMMAEQERDHHH